MSPEQHNELVGAAVAARLNAYAPYSNYQVGAAIRTPAGKVFTGCNVENASYGLCFCAERTAIVKAVSEGERTFEAIAVVTDGGGSPCGACRQFIAEFCDADTVVVVHDVSDGTEVVHTVGELLPHAFRLE